MQVPAGTVPEEAALHEWSMACELVRQAEAEAAARGAQSVTAVMVRAGILTGVVPELLARAYDMARVGTLLEGAPLTVEIVPAQARCPVCGKESSFEDFALVCPACGGIGLEVTSGDEILLARLELELPGTKEG
jgi:hydrogenase nickel incorporation protein HypA/HybF